MTLVPIDQDVREAIRTELHLNLCIEAGAGTGKTTVLVDRVAEALASGAATVDDIAVITFTEKAAAELSTRTRQRLEEAAEREADPDRRARLEAAGRGLYRAQIETIHAFAANLLRERPVEARIDPAFDIMSDLEAGLSFDAAYAAWLDDLLSQEHPEVRLALSRGLDLKQWRQLADAVHRNRWTLPLGSIEFGGADLAGFLAWLRDAAARLEGIAGRCTNDEDKGAVLIPDLVAWIGRVLEADGSERERLILRGLAWKWPPVNKGSKSSWDDPDECGRMKELFKDFRTDGEHENRPLASFQRDLRTEALLGLLPHVERFVLNYADERRAEGRADYDDLLVWARDLVRDSVGARAYFRRRFQRILIDEFQDTDPIQAEIAMYLASDGEIDGSWRELSLVDGKLTVVGDPKQSIYRFRRADIAVYDAIKRGPLAGGERTIQQNFRSTEAILGWINAVFEAVLVEEPGVQPGNVALAPAHASIVGWDRPAVVVVRAAEERRSADQAREEEARLLAAMIDRAVRSECWPVRDRATGDVRPAQWRDVAVLFPVRTKIATFEKAFTAAGIPHRHEGGRAFYQRQEVRELVSILQAIDDPTDRLNLVAALRSSAFGCSDEEIFLWSAGHPLDYRRVDHDANAEPQAVAFGLATLGELYRRRGQTGLPELVREALERTRMVETALTLPGGPQAAANLLKVAEQARAFASGGGGGLRAFARWLAQNQDLEADEDDASVSEETDDVVRMLTVHGAKGLEFPIVALANLGQGPQHDRKPMTDGEPGTLHVRAGKSGADFATPGYDARAEDEKRFAAAERLRLLYVGLTRARDHLVIPVVKARSHSPLETLSPHLPAAATELCAVIDGDSVEAPEVPATEDLPAPSAAEIEGAIDARAAWSVARDETIAGARRGLEVRPASAEASHGDVTAPLLGADDEPIIAGTGGPPREIGEALHKVMEIVSLDASPDEVRTVASAVCVTAGLPDSVDEVTELAMACLSSPVMDRARAATEVWREIPFEGSASFGYEVGRADLVFREAGGGLVVVDFKTDAVGVAGAGVAAEKYRAQGEAYAAAAGGAAEVVLVLARAGVDVPVGMENG